MIRFFSLTVFGLFILALACIGLFLLSALAIGAANAWVLQDTFREGWDTAWARPFITFLWGVLFFGVLGGIFSSN